MKKKELKRSFTFRAKDNEHETILKWLNGQDNVTDSLRYLIEREIIQNGVRNLQHNIPSERDFNPVNNDIYGVNQSNIQPSVLELINLFSNQQSPLAPVHHPVTEGAPSRNSPVQESEPQQTKVKKSIGKIKEKTVVNLDIDSPDISCWE